MARHQLRKLKDFKEFHNCFSEQRPPADWQVIFGNDNPITLELGCGKADISMALAKKYKQRNFVGVDIKATRLWTPAKQAIESKMVNVTFFKSHILKLGSYFPEHSIAEIWIPFPDPYPKKRQAKHRMVNTPFLELYKKLLVSGGVIHFKTDDLDLFHYALEVLVQRSDVNLHELTFDLHDSNLTSDTKVKTQYETRFISEGKKINYLRFSFLPNHQDHRQP